MKSSKRSGARTRGGAILLLIDIGNTHTHLAVNRGGQFLRQRNVRTGDWSTGMAAKTADFFVRGIAFDGAALCTVVPRAAPLVRHWLRRHVRDAYVELRADTVCGVGIDYPQPKTIGADRLANAVAARHRFGAPVAVVDFGTAVTFDVVDAAGNYVGGIIAPGVAAMTDYLHEKTALLPRIKIRERRASIGKSTEEAMLIGTVHGYRGLIQGLIAELKEELRSPTLPIVATGGSAEIIAGKLRDITAVVPQLTLEGLRLVWEAHQRK